MSLARRRFSAGDSVTRNAALSLAAVAGWLAATPYIGIDHDAVLYVAAAFRWLMPSAYANDPLFIDAQDRWSLFSPILAGVLNVVGVSGGAMFMTLLGGGLFLVSLWQLSGAMLRGPVRGLVFLLCASVPLAYASGDVLLVSEGFVTARIFSVPLSLMGVAKVLQRRQMPALLCLGAGFVLHPIMALAPVCLSLLLMAGRRAVILLALGWIVIALLFFAAASGLISQVDGRWLEHLQPDGVVFIDVWLRDEASFVLMTSAMLLLGSFFGTPRLQRCYAMTLVLVTSGVGVSLFAATEVHAALILQAQLWRVLWLGVLLAAIAAVDVLMRQMVRRHAPFRQCFAMGAVISLSSHGGAVMLLTVLFCFVSKSVLMSLEVGLGRHRRSVGALVVGVLMIHVPGYLAEMALRAGEFVGAGFPWTVLDGFMRTGGLGAFSVLVWLALRRGYHFTALLMLALYFCVVAFHWDQRAEDRRDWERRYATDGSQRLFADHIRRGEVVYWHRSAERVWHELATAGYAGRRHVAGIVFSRERFGVLEPRMERILEATLTDGEYEVAQASGGVVAYLSRKYAFHAEASSPQFMYRPRVLSSYERLSPLTAAGIYRLCADPVLDHVIDALRVEGAYAASSEDFVGGRRNRWYLYSCTDLRLEGGVERMGENGPV